MEKIKSKNKSLSSIGKYLPVFVILLAISIIIGSTFAYFTDKTEEESTLTFSKVELSGETTTGINGKLRDVIPGTPLVDGALKFSKSIDSEAIYVRAKISFSLPSEYANDNDMKEMVDLLRSATDFNIVSEAQNGAVWSAKDGNYFYLVESADASKLMRVDTVDTYTLSNEIVVPRDLKNLPDNAQYMKSVNFHIAFEAIQADNVSDILSETKEVFNTLFPQSEVEKSQRIKVAFKGFDLQSNLKVEEVKKGETLNEPVIEIPLDVNNEPLYIIDGWYTDSELTNKYEFGQVVEDGLTLYPRAYEVSQGLAFSEVEENGEVVAYSVAKGTCSSTDVVLPSSYNGKPVIMISDNAFNNITKIYLPNTIESIGKNAFFGCYNLTLKSLPSELKTIGNQAFQKCEKLTNLSLPNGLETIGDWAFYQCLNLEITELPSSLKSIGKGAFTDCVKIQLNDSVGDVYTVKGNCIIKNNQLIQAFITSVIPSEVTSLGADSYSWSTTIKLVKLHAGITSIMSWAFSSSGITYILCESDAVATLAQGKGRDNAYIYSRQETGYADGTEETEVVVNDSVTMYTATVDGYKWVRTSDNQYYKAIA